MNRYSVIAFNHHSSSLKKLEKLFVDEGNLPERLALIKKELKGDGLMYLATCNRMEFILSSSHPVNEKSVHLLLQTLHPEWNDKEVTKSALSARLYNGEEAVRHVIKVASSLDSMVVGEREIITQFRNAYEWSHQHGLTDDFIRILNRKTIETAKKVYTDTKIAEKPVSVMSLACRKMQEWHIGIDSRVVLIGAGQTADVMVKYLSKHGFTKFTLFNRTLKHAKELAERYNIEAYSLKDVEKYKAGFDVLITCVKSNKPIVDIELFDKLNNGEKGIKTIVDLGMPFNVVQKVSDLKNVRCVNTTDIEPIAKKNLEERKSEMDAANLIIDLAIKEFYKDLHSRKIEVAMRVVPEQVYKIREKAISTVFSKEISSLSPDSREVLDKVVDYLEKKYISIPMQMAKEILLTN